MACICFYFLSIILRVNPYIGIIGALAYAYATYNPVIISVGHDTKMQSIAILPGVIGSLILICEKRYWLGMMLLAMFTALLVSFNHVQIIYYTMIIATGLLLAYTIRWMRKGEKRRVARVLATALGASCRGCPLQRRGALHHLRFRQGDHPRRQRAGSRSCEPGRLRSERSERFGGFRVQHVSDQSPW